jgi:superfamily I DNA and RNA helicase
MSRPNARSLRIVVQHTRAHQRSVYRLVAYGGEGGDYTSRRAEFESLDRLLKALHSAVPDFDESTLSVRKGTPETYIAFAASMELDDSQLSLLGLKDGTRSLISELLAPYDL